MASFASLRLAAFIAVAASASLGCATSADLTSGGDDASVDSNVSVDTGGGGVDTAPGDTSPCAFGKISCSGTCVDLANDKSNCGKCGAACPTGASCVDGKCTASCTGGKVSCGGTCVDLLADPAHCGDCDTACGKDPSGVDKLCVDALCKLDCSKKTTCSGDTCVDLASDSRNCGKCGAACATGFECKASKCECMGTTTPCGGKCVDLTSDESNCGKCGAACTPSFSTTCTAGKCECSSSSETLCGTACVDLSSDDANCGKCGTACDTAASKVCTGGSCVLDCGTTGSDCGGVCKYLSFDSQNCGACGKKCGAGQYCNSGTCACSGGLSDCSGVCKDLKSDGGNCGFCGRACTSPSVCSGGGCATACGGGFTACGTSCLDTANDPNNCGACGKVCTTGICGGGKCLTAPKCSSGPYNILQYGPLDTSEKPYLPAGTVTVATEAMWKSMTAADFAKYNLIVFGEGGFCPSSTVYDTLLATKDTWSKAITGRIIITEQDPVTHSSTAGAAVFLRAALSWAAGGPGTGLYVYVGCTATTRNLDFMTSFGAFASDSTTNNTVTVVAPTHGSMLGSTSSSLSGWSSSAHGDINVYPSSFSVVVADPTAAAKGITIARDVLCGP